MVAAAVLASADVYEYQKTSLDVGGYLVRRVEMFSPSDAPQKSPPGNGNAFIRLELTFRRDGTLDAESPEGVIEVATVRDLTLDIGFNDGKNQHFCCTPQLAANPEAAGVCDDSKIDHLIIRNNNVQTSELVFAKGSRTAAAHGLNAQFDIKESGPHILVMSNCDPRLSDYSVSFSGRSVWMNPYGYLPATSYYFMPFYGAMALLFGFVAVAWLVLSAMHWKDIVALQNYITAVLAVCLVENMLLYFDYANFNSTGHRHEFTLMFGVLVTITRRTVARMLIMAVSIGFAIVRPDLGKNKKHIINFGVVYFCLGLTQQILIDLAKVHNGISDRWRMLLSIPVAAVDTGCYWFIFTSLYHLITMLRVRQQLVKLAVYKNFTKVLVFSLVCASFFSMYHLYLTASHQVLQHWRIWWLMDEGIWNMLFAIIFMAVIVLFRPSQSAKRYAYSQIATDMAEDEYGMDDGGIEMGVLDGALADAKGTLFSLGDDDEPVVDRQTAKLE